MRQTVVLFIALAVCGCAASRAQGQQEGKNAASPRECVAVIGAVNMPGRFELKRRVRSYEVLAFAGGPKKNAGATVQVISTGSKCPQETRDMNVPPSTSNVQTYQLEEVLGNTKPPNQEAMNKYLEAGDIVLVAEAESAYIVGAVVQPQQIVLRRPVTLTQAIAMAGGLKKDAKVEKVRILRHPRGSAERLELFVNLNAVRKKRSEDIVLQGDDIVEVPDLSSHGPLLPLRDVPVPKPVDRVVSGSQSGI
jgi:protein involved in polysaccharide export with SLBB domain